MPREIICSLEIKVLLLLKPYNLIMTDNDWIWMDEWQRSSIIVRMEGARISKESQLDEIDCTTNTTGIHYNSDDFESHLRMNANWKKERELEWHSTRLDIKAGGIIALDISLSVLCRPGGADEELILNFVRSSILNYYYNLRTLKIEILLTAPGYVPLLKRKQTLKDLVWDNLETFHEMGLAICPSTVDVSSIYEQVMDFIEEVQTLFATHYPEINYEQDPFVFKEIGSRGGLRYDALLNLDDNDDDRWSCVRQMATQTGPWLHQMDTIFGKDQWKVAGVSVVYSRPGAQHQGWHSDGQHLGEEAYHDGTGHADPYAACVFLPLIDLNVEVGFTQFFLKSHKSNLAGFGDTSHLFLEADFDGTLNAGQPIIYDYRLMHRGMPNNSSSTVRPLLQFLYSKHFYEEKNNYGIKSIYPNQLSQ